ncbi:hypothetical protein EJP82_17880 [Paenibacillus anaericanus]|uniref:Uncharacterized protein n=2 Tax=Paenibacillus TaxID=44249 RepID=A0A433Y608_9BACL|nr:hypothetical protein [Paenibacillus anaericanus]RUT44484.1 hypothetical protein EJP82_17880 [Paenibacillus anaericanus]
MNIISKKMITTIALGIVTIVFLCFGLITFYMKSYLPELPFEGMTKKQVYEKITNNNSIIYLTNSKGYNWYIYQGNQKDGRNEIIKRFNTLGIVFKEQLGAGIIFTSNNNKDEIIVESEMWTGKYIIFQVPDAVKF